MRVSRKLLRLRFVIYGVVIAFLAWEAFQKWSAEGQPPQRESELPAPTRMQVLPDGSQVPVYELTPEQAEKLLGVDPEAIEEPAKDEPKSPPAKAAAESAQ